MSVFRHMGPLDFLRLNVTNADHFSGEKGFASLLNYIMMFRKYCFVAEQPQTNTIFGFLVGKAEGESTNKRGFLYSVASLMMSRQTHLTELFQKFRIACEWSNCYYISTVVREFRLNGEANILDDLGYVIYQQINGFYPDGGNAFDMRLSLLRDVNKYYSTPAVPRLISHDAWLKAKERLGTPEPARCCSDCIDPHSGK